MGHRKEAGTGLWKVGGIGAGWEGQAESKGSQADSGGGGCSTLQRSSCGWCV